MGVRTTLCLSFTGDHRIAKREKTSLRVVAPTPPLEARFREFYDHPLAERDSNEIKVLVVVYYVCSPASHSLSLIQPSVPVQFEVSPARFRIRRHWVCGVPG